MDDYLRLFDVIGALARKRHQTAERDFSAAGFNHTEARLLTLLWREGGGAGQEALSEMIHVDRTNAGRALKRLEQDGYVVRKTDAADKRAKQVKMTAKGRKAVETLSKLKKKMAHGFFGDLTKEEAAAIADRLACALG